MKALFSIEFKNRINFVESGEESTETQIVVMLQTETENTEIETKTQITITSQPINNSLQIRLRTNKIIDKPPGPVSTLQGMKKLSTYQ